MDCKELDRESLRSRKNFQGRRGIFLYVSCWYLEGKREILFAFTLLFSLLLLSFIILDFFMSTLTR